MLKRLITFYCANYIAPFPHLAAALVLALAAAGAAAGWLLVEYSAWLQAAQSPTPGGPRGVLVGAQAAAPALAHYDSVTLAHALVEAAADTDVRIENVSYTMHKAGNQPFGRLTATFDVSLSYPAARAFIAGVLSRSSDFVLEQFACRRNDKKELPTCSFSVSLIFQGDGDAA
jgi:hypothetical protein